MSKDQENHAPNSQVSLGDSSTQVSLHYSDSPASMSDSDSQGSLHDSNSQIAIYDANQADKGELMTLEQMPQWLRDNPSILTGYRPYHEDLFVYIRSIFRLHNESFSIWSHLIASIYFLRLIGEIGEPHGIFRKVKNRAPMLAFLLSAFFGFAVSTAYHTWSPLSERARTLLVK